MPNPEHSMSYIKPALQRLYEKPKLRLHRELKQITFSSAQSTTAQDADTAEAVSMANATPEETANWIATGLRPGGSHDGQRWGSSRGNDSGQYRQEGRNLQYYDSRNMPRK